MTIRNTYSAESWDKVYAAFQQVNFTSYDYDTVKQALLQYLKIYHAEDFNDYIESSEVISILEMFAYVAELLAYRVDMVSHENFITTAQRKQSILRLSRLISYRASRNIPARGLVKINSVRTSEQIFDSLGNDLANVVIQWNDPNNLNWKEQFFLVMNRALTSKFGQPQKSFQVGDVLMQLYTYNNAVNTFKNGVYAFSTSGTSEQFPMEIVPVDIDENGPMERSPDLNSQMSIVYASDGKGDGSDFTGFLMFVKQGTMIRTEYTIEEPTENRRVELNSININDTDIWLYRVDEDNKIIENWSRVETLNEQNIVFNSMHNTRKKFEVETLENDRIALLFGDGNFSDAPVGDFQIWSRSSINQSINVPKNRVINQRMGFNYSTPTNTSEAFALTFSLTAPLQNNAPSEDIEHIRQAAPATYYSQNRMVNAQDYNTYMLKDQTILKMKTINRTFAGQSKYLEWNDASKKYENIKLFGDDLMMYYDVEVNDVTSTQSARNLIDSYLEPLLAEPGVFNILTYITATHPQGYGIISFPRRRFVEDNRSKKNDGTNRYIDGINGGEARPYGNLVEIPSPIVDGSLKEKTAIQGALDRHFYGEPRVFVTIDNIRHGVITDPTSDTSTSDGKLYDENLKRTIDSQNTWPPGDTGSGFQSISNEPYFGIRFNPFLKAIGSLNISILAAPYGLDDYKDRVEVFTIEVQSDRQTLTVISNLRGALPNGRVGYAYSQLNANPPIDFIVPLPDEDANEVLFEEGDAFILDVKWSGLANKNTDPDWLDPNSSGYTWQYSLRQFNGETKINLSGWFELIRGSSLSVDPNSQTWPVQRYSFDPDQLSSSWVFMVWRNDNQETGDVEAYRIFYREMKLVIESPTTKFWYNQTTQIIDSDTKKPVYDKIRILRSNLDSIGRPLKANHVYDVTNVIYNSDGSVVTTKLEVLPEHSVAFTTGGDATPDNVLQFEHFSADSYQFGVLNVTSGDVTWLSCGQYEYLSGYDINPYDTIGYDGGVLSITAGNYVTLEFTFHPGEFFTNTGANTGGLTLVRRRYMPFLTNSDNSCNLTTGLDFMWQHFSPNTNLIDPSVTNIHDAFIMTRGYYNNVIDYVKGLSIVQPTPPSSLELRSSYGYLLQNKMLSDTMVMHSGTIKLLFGQLASHQLRAKFRVVKAPNATFSNERIKTEIISVIDTYFNIQYWDFGDKFYATELLSLIHQRLPTQIASVVLVPMHSVNSFGSLFTIDSGFDEILQSCATINDVEIVAALTPTVLRQNR